MSQAAKMGHNTQMPFTKELEDVDSVEQFSYSKNNHTARPLFSSQRSSISKHPCCKYSLGAIGVFTPVILGIIAYLGGFGKIPAIPSQVGARIILGSGISVTAVLSGYLIYQSRCCHSAKTIYSDEKLSRSAYDSK